MFKPIFKQAVIVAVITIIMDFLFHVFLTNPMESITYFVIKFLLAFTVATALFSLRIFEKSKKKLLIIVITGLIFSTLMSTYYRAWEFGEAHVPFGSRAPDIIGIPRNVLILFSGIWWLSHAFFFGAGAYLANKFKNSLK